MKRLVCAALVSIVCLVLIARREDIRRFREKHNI